MAVSKTMRELADDLLFREGIDKLSTGETEEQVVADVAQRFCEEGMSAHEAARYALFVGYLRAVVDMKRDLISN